MRKWFAAGVLALVAVGLVAAAALGGFAQGNGGAAKADAIAVEGKWKVTVKDPDGSVVRTYRFHNEFNGASTVSGILAHTNSTGRYWMTLSDQSGANQHPCGDPTGPAAQCFLFEGDDPNGAVAFWFDTVEVTRPGSTQVQVTGEIAATRSGQFNHVRMLLSTCGSATAPNVCHPGAYGNFSSRTLPSPISLIAGQQAIVTVTYTFSAA